jgi:hypothetical protein
LKGQLLIRWKVLRTRDKDVLIPQFEHARLAGLLARHWGNREFDRPPFDFDSFVKGVLFHDRAYGQFDAHELGAMSPREQLKLLRIGIQAGFDDICADIVVKMHCRRLLSHLGGENVAELAAELDERLSKQIEASNISAAEFQWADRITDFCDSVSFRFCSGDLGRDHTGVNPRHSSRHAVALHFEVGDGGRIRVHPWPFRLPEITGLVVGYEPRGYPQRREPVVLDYRVVWWRDHPDL